MEIYLEKINDEEEIYDYYQISWSNSNILIYQGKIGFNCTPKKKQFKTKEEANGFFYDHLVKKINDGYKKSIKGWRPSFSTMYKKQLYFDFYSD